MKTSSTSMRRDERGVISIFTVMMFAILMSILAVGFVRLTLDEQQQTLQDDLSKSAYNAAQAGIEDAKRAMVKCKGIADPTDRAVCESQLYEQDCPGFNKTNYFSDIGIPISNASQTSVGDSETAQGYSCVVVTPNTDDLAAELTVDAANDTVMYALDTINSAGAPTPLTSLKLEWHTSNPVDLKTRATLTAANPRKGTGQWANAPALMRLTLIKTDGAITSDISGSTAMRSTFIYPVSDTGSGAISFSAPLSRYFTRCTSINPATGSNYACSVDINIPLNSSARHYIALKTLYNSTQFRLTASGASGPLQFQGVEPSIDSTGYTSGAYRRVQARVQPGADVTALNAALEAGNGICKDFTVTAVSFSDSCAY